MNIRLKLSLIACFLMLLSAQAQIRLPQIIGSNMVLQRNQPVPVWGWVGKGKAVKVKFAGQQKGAVANADGYWKVILSPLTTSDKPHEMVITSDTSTIKLSNILIGEVWLGSGQSNMEYLMKVIHAKPAKGVDSAELELSTSNPMIRLFKVEKKLSLPDVTTKYGWHQSEGAALAEFSAPAYYFAKRLYNALHIPIGVIASSWGGSRIEPWTPASAYANLPAFKDAADKQFTVIDSVTPGKDYESMIKPIAPFALRGFIWYQGESNCMTNEGIRYADKMQALVDCWRKDWNNPKAPFYSVLIAPYLYTKRKDHVPHTPQTLPEFWEAQIESLKIPYTEIVTVTDLVDNVKDIHPSYKWEVGHRLAMVALAKDYGYKNLVYSGPRYKGVQIKGNKVTVQFNYANELKTNDGKPVDNFEVAGADGKYYPAVAEISGNKLVVSSNEVSNPVNIRFAWTETAMPNLINSTGLPALPFRTDAKSWSYVKQ